MYLIFRHFEGSNVSVKRSPFNLERVPELKFCIFNQIPAQPPRHPKRFRWWTGGLLLSFLTLSSCANTPWGAQMQQSLEADPQLQNGTVLDASNANPSADLPLEIPRYPDAKSQDVPADVKARADEQDGRLTYWVTADSATQVEQFYRDRLSKNGWQIQPAESSENLSPRPENTDATQTSETTELQPLGSTQSNNTTREAQGTAPTSESTQPNADQTNEPTVIMARQQNLMVRVALQPDATNDSQTAFTIQYRRNSESTQNSDSANNADSSDGFSIRPANEQRQTSNSSPNRQNQSNSDTFTDLNQAPADLRPYIRDLAELNVLTAAPAADKAGEGQQAATNQFQPNQSITRREFARWLVEANNTIYADEAKERIRLAVESSNPAFADVPQSDPDFEVIQGLAEVGLVPSSLAGNATAVNFRPDAPLTREDLLLWKVPLDTRQALPSASVEAVQEAWGFQDAGKIDPGALKAVLADHQNGDFANIPRAFGYTTLFQPQKAVTRAEAAAALWRIGNQNQGITAEEVLNRGT